MEFKYDIVMKNYISHTLIILSVLLNSCKTEEFTQFQSLENIIQNEGYFPLAPNNAWVFENRTAKKDGNNYVYKKDTDSVEVQSVIGKVNEVYVEDDLNPTLEYLVAPYSINDVALGMFGSLSKVSKENGEYTRKLAVSFTDAFNNGKVYKSMRFEIDQKFLSDNYSDYPFDPDTGIAPIDKIIHSKNENFTSPDGGISIDYTIETKLMERYKKMPVELTSKVGVDNQLSEFEDILHTRDIITIKKIVLTEKVSNRLNIDAEVQFDKSGGSIQKIDIPEGSTGSSPGRPPYENGGDLSGVLQFGDLPDAIDYGSILNLWVNNIGKIGIKSTSTATMCPGTGRIKVNSELIAKPMEVITNQEFMIIDQYWAKGVGNIKNITEYKKLTLYADAKDYLMTEPFKINITKDDPACGIGADGPDSGQENTLGLTVQLNVNVSNLKLDIPFILSEDIIIQNLKRHKLRNTLN